ncbi:MAG TPA: VTT domain-containing protein [Roseiflexaceae bacterium]|nr:VTT domain-containing protein [Roseiflexaceae bacterium]
MSDLADTLLTAVLAYGAPTLGLVLFVVALGIPLPATLLLLASGAFVSQGVLDGPLALGLGLFGSVLGDSASYCLGRCGGALVIRRFERAAAWRRAQATFDRRGGLLIFFTRFMLTPLALPTNLIAGSSRYTYGCFLTLDALGELIWITLYGGLGYAFAGQWETVSELAGNLTGVLIGLLALVIGVALAYRARRRRGTVAIAAKRPS